MLLLRLLPLRVFLVVLPWFLLRNLLVVVLMLVALSVPSKRLGLILLLWALQSLPLLLLFLRFVGLKRPFSNFGVYLNKAVPGFRFGLFFWGLYGRVDSFVGTFYRWIYIISLIPWVFVLIFFLMLPSPASAAGVTYQTTRVGPAAYVTNGVTSPITVNVAPVGGVARYQQIRPVASPSTLGKLARGALRGGVAGIAVTGVVEGLGYLIDQATGQVLKPGQDQKQWPDGSAGKAASYTGFWNYPQSCSGFASQSCYASVAHINPTGSSYVHYRYSCTTNGQYLVPSGVVVAGDGTTRYGFESTCRTVDPESVPVAPGPPVPAAPSEIAVVDNAIGSGLSLSNSTQVINYVLSEASPRGSIDTSQYPITLTSSNSLTQELFESWPALQIAYQNMLNAELAALLAAADPNFEPSPDEQVIVDNGSEVPPMAPVGDLPAFCEWASFICEPFVSDEHPPIPTLELEVPSYDSGLPTTAICPVPYELVTSFGAWDITFQFACDMASAIRIPLTAISYLMAGFIVVGVRK